MRGIQSTLASVAWTPGEAFKLDFAWATRLLDMETQIDRFLQLEQANFALISATLAESATLIDQ